VDIHAGAQLYLSRAFGMAVGAAGMTLGTSAFPPSTRLTDRKAPLPP